MYSFTWSMSCGRLADSSTASWLFDVRWTWKTVGRAQPLWHTAAIGGEKLRAEWWH